MLTLDVSKEIRREKILDFLETYISDLNKFTGDYDFGKIVERSLARTKMDLGTKLVGSGDKYSVKIDMAGKTPVYIRLLPADGVVSSNNKKQ